MSDMAGALRRSSRRTQPPSYLTDYSTEYIGYSYEEGEAGEAQEDPWQPDARQAAPPCSQQADSGPAASPCPPAELEKMQNNVPELHKTTVHFGASVQDLAHWLDEPPSSPSHSAASAEASTHGSPTGRDLPSDDCSPQRSSCQVDESILEEMCHRLQPPEFQASHGLTHDLCSPPSGSHASLSLSPPPPPTSTTPSPEPQHLQPSRQLSGLLSAPDSAVSPASAQAWDHWDLDPFPHHLGYSATSEAAPPLGLTHPGVTPMLIPAHTGMSSGLRGAALCRGGLDLSSYAAQPMDLSGLQLPAQRASYPPLQTVPAPAGVPSFTPYRVTRALSFPQMATGVLRTRHLHPCVRGFPPYAFTGLHPPPYVPASPRLLAQSPPVRAPTALHPGPAQRPPAHHAAAHRSGHVPPPYPPFSHVDPQRFAALHDLHGQKRAVGMKERTLLEQLQLHRGRRCSSSSPR